jgi:4a-hydroxytetrahydrobiopterin dehydratase
MDTPLSSQKCFPCEGKIKPLTRTQSASYLSMVPQWTLNKKTKIERDFKFKNFVKAIEFINKVAEIAEQQGHHPDILLHNWNKVRFSLTTHAIKGLSLNDFIIASKIDHLFDSMYSSTKD